MIPKKKCRFTRTGRSFPDSSETGILINEEPFFVQSKDMKLPIRNDWNMNIEPEPSLRYLSYCALHPFLFTISKEKI